MPKLSESVASWAGSLIGSAIASAEELTGGASRTSFILTAASGKKYFLRMDLGNGPLSGTRYTLGREYSVLEFLQDKDVPVAGMLGYSAEHDAILMEFVAGQTSYERISSAEEEAVLQQDLIASIVRLQKLDASKLKALGASGASLGEAIRQDLAEWRELYDQNVTPRNPLLEFCVNWLVVNVPDAENQPVIVHGDIGPGNFLIDQGRVRALIDWEMVRVGHPLEDLACIIARGLGAYFGKPTDHIAHYEKLTGAPVDTAKLDYALVLVMVRWLIAISMALSRPSAAQNVPMLFAFRQINARAMVEALCRSYGLVIKDERRSLVENATIKAATVYSTETLALLAGNSELPRADRYKIDGVKDLFAYVKSFVDYGPETYAREDTQKIAALVPPGNDPRLAICDYAASVDPKDAAPLVEYLRWLTMREHDIMRTSLNARADNVIIY
jgi:aminoglycoside phosphotransferase (APT) family kinase protein